MDFVLHEAALSRILTHASKGFMVVSAFRQTEYTLEENLKRHEDMKDALKKWHLGFFELVGYWDESKAPEWDDSKDYPFEENIILNELDTMDFKISPRHKRHMAKDLSVAQSLHAQGGGDPNVSVEYSLFIPYNPEAMDYRKFLSIGMFLSEYWGQDGFIAMDRKNNQIVLINQQRTAHPLGEVSFKNISYAYSRLHADMGKTFLFEGCAIADSISSLQVAHSRGYILSENTYFINIYKNVKLLSGNI